MSGNFEVSQQSEAQRAEEEMGEPEISSNERPLKRARIEHSEAVEKAITLLTSPTKQRIAESLKRKSIEPSASIQFGTPVLLPSRPATGDSTPSVGAKQPTIFSAFKDTAKAAALRSKQETKSVSEKLAPFRLLSALDYDKGVMKLSILESEKEQVRSIEDYKATLVSYGVDNLTPDDLITLSQTTQQMLHREIHKKHTDVKKLQQSLEKAESLLKVEKVANSARGTKIKDLEAKIMRLGVHPQEAEATKDLIAEKDKEIAHLKGKLKMNPRHPVQTLELMTATAEKEEA